MIIIYKKICSHISVYYSVRINDGAKINETYYDITANRYLTENFIIDAFNYGG